MAYGMMRCPMIQQQPQFNGQPQPCVRLAVHRLQLTRFRNYREVLVEPQERSVVLTGPNGAGKTNILEALSLLAPGRGMRGATLPQLGQQPGGAGGLGSSSNPAGSQ